MGPTIYWHHLKTGKDYVIRDFGIDEITTVPVVIYHEYGKPDAIWVRPCFEFFDGRFRMSSSRSRGIKNPVGTNPPVEDEGDFDPDPWLGSGPFGSGRMTLGGRDLTDPAQDPQVGRRDSVAMRPRQTAPEKGDDG